MSGGIASQQLKVLETIELLLQTQLTVQCNILAELDKHTVLLQKVVDYLSPEALTVSVVNVFSGANMADNALVLNIGQASVDTLTPRDASGNPSGGVVSNVAVSFSDPSATAVLNPDGVTITFTGVAAGSSSGSTSSTVTDTNGAVSQFTSPFTVTVNSAPPPPALTTVVDNVFSAPTP